MIILMGVIGVGKSVQGQLLADALDYNWFSTGEYFRSTTDPRIRNLIAQGVYISDQEMIEIIDEQIGKTISDTTILDGFPRTTEQAEWLKEQATNGRFAIEGVVELYADNEELISRLMKRGRVDDTPETIQKRIDTYNEKTQPLIDWFRQQKIQVHSIDGVGDPKEISTRILGALKHVD